MFFLLNNLEDEGHTTGNNGTEDTGVGKVGGSVGSLSASGGAGGGAVGGTVGDGAIKKSVYCCKRRWLLMDLPVLSDSGGGKSSDEDLELHCECVYVWKVLK